MKLNAYCIYDVKAGAYLAPYFLRSDGEALRSFGDCANDPGHQIHRHAEDYILYRIGTFDDGRGCMEQLVTVVCLAKAVELLKPPAAPLFDNLARLDPKDRFEQESA